MIEASHIRRLILRPSVFTLSRPLTIRIYALVFVLAGQLFLSETVLLAILLVLFKSSKFKTELVDDGYRSAPCSHDAFVSHHHWTVVCAQMHLFHMLSSFVVRERMLAL